VSDICRGDAAYVLGALSPAGRREFEDHLRDCPDCRESVQRLAGMPGLLALTTADDISETGPGVPNTILPALIARARSVRRRRRLAVGGLLAASIAVLIALVGTVITQSAETYPSVAGPSPTVSAPASGTEPSSPPSGSAAPGGSATAAPPAVDEPMTRLSPGPMSASVELADKRWGTAITVVCQYEKEVNPDIAYDITVIDTDGGSASAGTWRAVSGGNYRISAATALTRDHIAALEVRLPDGEPILRSSLR
jgi:hypothetical protein